MMTKNEFSTWNGPFSFCSLHNIIGVCTDFLFNPRFFNVDIVLGSIRSAMKCRKHLHGFKWKSTCGSHSEQVSVCGLSIDLAIFLGIIEHVFPTCFRVNLLQIFVSFLQTLIHKVSLELTVIGSFKSVFPRINLFNFVNHCPYRIAVLLTGLSQKEQSWNT